MISGRQGGGDAGVLFGYSEEQTDESEPTNFRRIAKIDALYVRPKGEGHGCPESKIALD